DTSATLLTRDQRSCELWKSGHWCRRSRLKRKPIPQILPARDNATDDRALAFTRDQGIDEIDLVHGDELQDFFADLSGRIARKRVDHLQALRRRGPLARLGDDLAQRTVGDLWACFDEGVEAGSGAAVGERDYRGVADLCMCLERGGDQWRVLDEPR